ncbi:hypothetical protein FRN31_22095 [Vibrio alginolyticus]|nr:hypothetical protein [Vibrio alginolyticus]
MSQSNSTAQRVPLTKGELVLNVLYQKTGSDSDYLESLFYELNPTVTTQHIPQDGEYWIPTINTAEKTDSEAVLLVWE